MPLDNFSCSRGLFRGGKCYIIYYYVIKRGSAQVDIIKAEKLTYSGGNGPGHYGTLNKLSLTASKGELICALGAAGAGKTSLLHALVGLLKAESGAFTVSGMDCGSEQEHWKIRKVCSLVLENAQDNYLYTSVRQELSFALHNFNPEETDVEKSISDALAMAGLKGCEDRFVPLLSAFERYCLAIASAIVYEPEILLVDAAAEGFDARERERIFKIIRDIHNSGKTVIYTSRNAQDAVMAQRTVVLKDGSVVADGASRDVLSDGKLLSDAGLELPFTVRVYYDLLEAGAELSFCPLNIDELVDEVCK